MKDITEPDTINNIPLCCSQPKNWLEELLFIAGPCTVESENQLSLVAEELNASGITHLRAGAFKPLTFPYRNKNMYELREKGLELLASVRSKHGLKIVSELTENKMIDLYKDCVDIIQIGSRNMYNYELLITAAKTGKPILLKRHFGASLRDWLGAAEYILANGNDRVILCERGITVPHTHSSTSRFVADIQVIPAAKAITNLPIIFDPSHATFNRDIVAPMTYAAIMAGADGIIIETHPDPENAAVDRLNGVTLPECSRIHANVKRLLKADLL